MEGFELRFEGFQLTENLDVPLTSLVGRVELPLERLELLLQRRFLFEGAFEEGSQLVDLSPSPLQVCLLLDERGLQLFTF